MAKTEQVEEEGAEVGSVAETKEEVEDSGAAEEESMDVKAEAAEEAEEAPQQPEGPQPTLPTKPKSQAPLPKQHPKVMAKGSVGQPRGTATGEAARGLMPWQQRPTPKPAPATATAKQQQRPSLRPPVQGLKAPGKQPSAAAAVPTLRPSAAGKAKAASPRAPGEPAPNVHVYSTSEEDELGIKTLVCGDYQEAGEHHQKKFFKKVLKSPEEQQLFLYFWDGRDGDSTHGWWFGNEVGGATVWLQNKQRTCIPPRAGWVWSNGRLVKDIFVETVAAAPQAAASGDAEAAKKGEGAKPTGAASRSASPRAAPVEVEDDPASEAAVGRGASAKAASKGLPRPLTPSSSGATPAPAAAGPVKPQDWASRVLRITERVDTLEVDVVQGLEVAHLASDCEWDLGDASALRASELLTTQLQQLNEVTQLIESEGLQRATAPKSARDAGAALLSRLRPLQAQVREAQRKLQSAQNQRLKRAEADRKRQEQEAQQREADAKNAAMLEEVLQGCPEKVEDAEDAVERVGIAASPLALEVVDFGLEEVMDRAVVETEERLAAARRAIDQARTFLASRVTVAAGLAWEPKASALDQIRALQQKLGELQIRLEPFAGLRRRHQERTMARRAIDRLSRQVTDAEMEVEKAVMASTPVGEETPEAAAEAEAAVEAGQAALLSISRIVESTCAELPKERHFEVRFKELRERLSQASEKLQEAVKATEGLRTRAAAEILVRQAAERMGSVEAAMQQVVEVDALLVEAANEEDVSRLREAELVAEAERSHNEAVAAFLEAESFVRSTASHRRGTGAIQDALQQLEDRASEGRRRLEQLRVSTSRLQRARLVREASVAVAAAEADVRKLGKASKALSATAKAQATVEEHEESDGEGHKAGATPSWARPYTKRRKDGKGAVGERDAQQAEQAARSSIMAARKLVIDTTAELRKLSGQGAVADPEILKLQSRLSALHQEVVNLRGATKEAEELLRARAALADLVGRVQGALSEADAAAASAAALVAGGAESAPEADQVQRNVSAVQSKISTVLQLVRLKLQGAVGGIKGEVEAMERKLVDAAEKMSSTSLLVRSFKDRQRTSDIIAEATRQVEIAEEAVGAASEAELPLLTGVEGMAGETEQCVVECEAAIARAQKAFVDAKGAVSQASADSRRLSPELAKVCNEDIADLQRRLEVGGSKLAGLARDTAERRAASTRQQSLERVVAAEEAVKKLVDALARFADSDAAALGAEEAQQVCVEFGKLEHEARRVIQGAQEWVNERHKEARSVATSASTAAVQDLGKLQTRLRQSSAELQRFAARAKEWEMRFVSAQLLALVPTTMELVRHQVGLASRAAAPLLAADPGAFLEELRTQAVAQSLRDLAAKSGEAVSVALLGEAAAASRRATVQALAAVLPQGSALEVDTAAVESGLPSTAPLLRLAAGQPTQAAEAFVRAAGGDPEVGLPSEQLQAFVAKERMVVSTAKVPATADLDGGGAAVTLEEGELVDVLEQVQDENGAVRTRCALLFREAAPEVWVLEKDAKGTRRLESCGWSTTRATAAEVLAGAAATECAEAAELADVKAEGCGSNSSLREARQEMLLLKMRAKAHYVRAKDLAYRVASAQEGLVKQLRAEVEAAHEARASAATERLVGAARAAIEAAEAEGNKFLETAKLPDSSGGAAGREAAQPAAFEQDGLQATCDEVLRLLATAKESATTGVEKLKEEEKAGASRSQTLSGRVELIKIKSRAEKLDKACREVLQVATAARREAAARAKRRAREALRAARLYTGETHEKLFERFVAGGSALSDEQLGQLVDALPGHGVETAAAVRALKAEETSDGVRRWELGETLQEFLECSRPVAISSALDVSSSAVRTLEAGEIFEVWERPFDNGQGPDSRELVRVRGRALRDGVEGWTTEVGNLGTVFLSQVEKPYLVCTSELPLQEEPLDDSPTLRTIGCEEVLEVLEGPRRVDGGQAAILQVEVGDVQGWLIQRDISGSVRAECLACAFVCRSAIAMTDAEDLRSCAVVRKIAVGEVLQALSDSKEAAPSAGSTSTAAPGGPASQPAAADGQQPGGADAAAAAAAPPARRRFRALRDGAEGWVTLRGAVGAAYLEASDCHYVARHRIAIRALAEGEVPGATDAVVVRWLEAGEAFAAKGPPTPTLPSRMVARLRSCTDSAVGWALWPCSAPGKPPLEPLPRV